MKLYFKCKTNYDHTEINCAIFTKDGKEYEIDCWEAAMCSYDPVTGECELYWDEIYTWEGSSEVVPHEDFFRGAKFEGFEINDDAPDDYEVSVEGWEYTETYWEPGLN